MGAPDSKESLTLQRHDRDPATKLCRVCYEKLPRQPEREGLLLLLYQGLTPRIDQGQEV